MTGQTEAAMKFVRERYPTLEGDLLSYVESILEGNTIHFESSEEIFEAIGGILGAVDSGRTEEDIQYLCQKVYHLLECGDDKEGTKRLLDAPVNLGELANQGGRVEETCSIWMRRRDDNSSLVNSKKLEKAEAKIKEKQDKRQTKADSSVTVPKEVQTPSVSQQVNKRDLTVDGDGAGRSADIKIENFDIAFGNKVLLHCANVNLAFGRRYGLVGRNGLGKTTLLKNIANGELRIPSHFSVLHVEQEVVGDDTIALDSVLEADTHRAQLLAEVAHIQAHPDNGTTEHLSELYAQLASCEADKAPAKASVIMHGLGFTPEMQRMPTREFSGGWRMRLALARALFSRPDLLLLDEPTNMLDMKAVIWLEDYLQTWPSTAMIVSHDREFLNAVATDIIHLHSQRLDPYKGNFENFATTREEKVKNQQREYDAQVAHRAHVQEFIDKFRYNAKRASLVQSKIKYLEKLPKIEAIEKETKVTLKFPECEKLSPPILQLDEVEFSYSTSRQIFKNICINAAMDSRICIVGENGAGKTTLLKILLGDLSPVNGIRHAHRSLRIGYFSQHHVDSLDMNQCSVEFFASNFPGNTSEYYRGRLGSFGVSGDLALKPIGSLSGGQKSRVAFAVMCMSNPNFLILDEPTNHLDMETIQALGDAINSFGGGVVLVSHDERLINMICKELWLCSGGQVIVVEGGISQYRRLIEKELADSR